MVIVLLVHGLSMQSLLCRTLKDIASTEGKNSQDRKMQLITKLLVAARQNEAGYLIRCLQVLRALSSCVLA